MKGTAIRNITAIGLAAMFAVGCASTPKPAEEAPAPAPAPAPEVTMPAGPSMGDASSAVDAAAAALANAKPLCGLWRDSAKNFEKARAALKAGDYANAIKLANKAKAEAEDCVAQAYEEKARALLWKLEPYRDSMYSNQIATIETAEKELANHNGKRAYDLLSNLYAEIMAASSTYNVVGGDSLWTISARSNVYDNAYQWPLIYKNNRDQIEDADLIFPGQAFNIKTYPTDGDTAAAVEHARNRGAWSVGTVEASDTAYLAD